MSLPVRATRAAIAFLTRVPVGSEPISDEESLWAPAYFPLVGAGVGLAAAIVHMSSFPLGAGPAAVLCVAAGLLLTGAFHEDGLADTADALGGSFRDRERLLKILKDSRIGAFGAAALIISLALQFSLLAELGAGAPLGLVLAHALSRIAPVWQLATLPYITPAAQARSSDVAKSGPAQAWQATWIGAGLLTASILFAKLSLAAALGIVASLFGLGLLSGWRYQARAGGVCGDFLGATQQLGQAAVLAVLVLAGSLSG
ncbi:MAG: adenosylcobinamide-GDP ribazoletransferase [Deltaproteobacteria bacterium]|nr:adenosylcobinamide-GDP ribazoletransferase [Deltaproteobacteria bacterium]MBW2393787.1 adenosylcobinamide-GDP ribazoletransferase [Deltaproteobacteria bacterium]